MAEKVMTGNEVEVRIDGIVLELMQSIRFTDDYGHEDASGIGDLHVQEHVPTVARHTATMSKLAVPREVAVELGIVNENGDSAMEGRTFDIEVFSKVTGALIRKIINCVNVGGDIGFTAHRMIMTDAQFRGRDVSGTYRIR
jgi:hypothetical protein